MRNNLKRLTASERISETANAGSFEELNAKFETYDPLNFTDYKKKIETERLKTGLNEAVITGFCTIHHSPCVLIVMDSNFMMGSMGSIVGEKICRAFEKAMQKKLSVVAFVASGGARMQESAYSLVQMAKTSGMVKKHNNKGLLYISVITDPTTGGVSASFASLADIIIAEPSITYGFTGRRIIQETLKKELPDDFQTAESALKNGAIDMIVEREKMKSTLSDIIKLHMRL